MKVRKFILTIIIMLLFLTSFNIAALAHSGGTDAKGGHYDRSAGEYHYHHCYSAHEHKNGKCPYDFNDNTDDDNDTNSKKTSSKKLADRNYSLRTFLLSVPTAVIFMLILGIYAVFIMRLILYGIVYLILKLIKGKQYTVSDKAEDVINKCGCIITWILAYCVSVFILSGN